MRIGERLVLVDDVGGGFGGGGEGEGLDWIGEG